NDAEAAARADKAALSGKLRIAAPLSFGLTHLKPVISDFIRANPDLDVEVDFSDRKVNLVEEGFDVAVRIGVLADSTLIARKLIAVRSVCAASPEFWARRGAPQTPEDLEALDCLRYLNAARPDVIEYWAPDGERGSISPPVRLFASNGDFIASMAAEDCGFIVEPYFLLAPYLESGALTEALANYSWSAMNLFIVTPPSRRVTARVRAFSDAVAEQFKEHGADVI
ncbi:MAG: substrate binding domain-containing protein, partial [Pseudomonadota bacterium]